MSEPFLAEIKIVGFNFAPLGWAFCDGQILPINQNQSLYSLLGTTYGGDGRTSFALPELRGRTPVHPGADGVTLGQKAGEENHLLTIAEMPAHTHTARASSTTGNNPNPGGGVLAATAPAEVYHGDENRVAMRSGTVADAGGSQGHDNMQPYLTLNFCIALQGLFPSRN
jgi:microcystin-dependent protein